MIIAACIAEVSSRYEETGGLYLYARDALGRFPGLLVAWLTWLTRIAAPAAVANLFCTYLAQFFPLSARAWENCLILVASDRPTRLLQLHRREDWQQCQ